MGGSVFIGRVVSNRMQKTVVVAVSYAVWVPKYKVYQRRVSRHMAHDAEQSCNVGDIVRIQASRKMSRHKSYKVTDVVKRAAVFDPQQVQQWVADRAAAPRLDAVQAAQKRLDEASQRLKALRDMFEKEVGAGAQLSGSIFQTPATVGSAKP
mmetsp:Transcript_31301/g.69684  ORF Transcript_31301/g.69684 Transcript_31301/m.69684 type:complete len:152 (-) Transcript_31301:642-1097(-)